MATDSVALITGGASGMGLAVAEKLASLGWYLSIVDYTEDAGKAVAERLGDKVVFHKADVTNYDELAVAFKKTWEARGRLDVVFSNAGIVGGDFYTPAEENSDGIPAKPDTKVIDVNLLGCVYGGYLALHYIRKNPNKKGKIIYNASMAGLYSADLYPLYTASKHGVVGLSFATARALKARGEGITVNCICPGMVETGLTGPLSGLPQIYVTPVSTIVRAFETFLNDDSRNAQTAECSGENIYFKSLQPYSDDAAKFVMEATAAGPLEEVLSDLKAGGESN